jgi:GT2 family glycosyltransferase
LVHVIVLNWHGWRDTIACLRSLKGLDYPNYRTLIVDNGSTDDSVARIREAHPDVDILETGKNLGFSGGNNAGIQHALDRQAEHVWLLNNDTVADAGALSAMVAAAQQDEQVGAVGSVLHYMDRPDQIQAWGGGRVNVWFGRSRSYLAPVDDEQIGYITGASLLIRTRALKEVGLLDDGYFMYWEDADFGLRLRAAGWRLTVARESKVWHKEAGTLGVKSPVVETYSNTSYVRFCRRHAPVPLIPIVFGVASRVIKRIWLGDWERVRAVCKGAYIGYRSK